MNNKPENKKSADEVLNSIDHIQRATPKPFFYTRLMARLDKQNGNSVWERTASFISKPVFAIAAIVVFLFFNIVILYNSSPKATVTAQDDSTLAIENDYGLSVPSLYDINPDQNEIAQK